DRAIAALRSSAAARAVRAAIVQPRRSSFLGTSTPLRKLREVYDAGNTDRLPGVLARKEDGDPVADPAVNEAYDFAGDTFDFFNKVFGRNSLDNEGRRLVSSVHVADIDLDGQYSPMNNGYWNGRQMAYGDGDGVLFRRFTQSLDVVAHELTHGV